MDLNLADLLQTEDSGGGNIPSLSELFSASKTDNNTSQLMINSFHMQTDKLLEGLSNQNTNTSFIKGLPSLTELSFQDDRSPLSLSGLYNLSERKETDHASNFPNLTFSKPTADNNVPTLSMLANTSSHSPNVDSSVIEEVKNLSLVDLANDHLMKVEQISDQNIVKKQTKKQQPSRRRMRKVSNFLNVIGAKLKTPTFSPKGFSIDRNCSLPYLVYISRKRSSQKDMKDIFLFTTSSPDDIVHKHQQKAFQRDGLKD